MILCLLLFGLFGYVAMRLWNWLMPPLFGLREVTFWQAVGILVLSRLLFGGFRPRSWRHRHWNWRRRMFERWEQMTPEEREKFREGMRRRCGPFAAPAEKPQV
jgi:hypothetical protein